MPTEAVPYSYFFTFRKKIAQRWYIFRIGTAFPMLSFTCFHSHTVSILFVTQSKYIIHISFAVSIAWQTSQDEKLPVCCVQVYFFFILFYFIVYLFYVFIYSHRNSIGVSIINIHAYHYNLIFCGIFCTKYVISTPFVSMQYVK